MKTDQLIRMLASGAGPTPHGVPVRRIGIALIGGVLASAAVCLGALGLNPGLDAMGQALLVKLAYVLGVLGSATWWLYRMGYPAGDPSRPLATLLIVVTLMAMWSFATIAGAPGDAGVSLLLGRSWASCPWRVAMLSLPAWGIAFWALRGLAPTRPRHAGFAAGLFAGAAGALGYALFCPEVSPAFVSLWYSLGMLLPALVGAGLGPRLLRW